MFQSTSLLFVLLFFGLTSCEFSHDEIYEEPITSALFVFTPDTGRVVVLQYLDRDGEGGLAPLITEGRLQPNTTYNCQIQLNAIGKHITDSTSIAQEPEIHQVFFLAQNGLPVETEYTDRDSNGFPIGLNSTIITGAECSGQLSVIIKHNPNKAAAGVVDGTIDNAGGSTDFQVSFDVTIG